jgi:hypothetical protein
MQISEFVSLQNTCFITLSALTALIGPTYIRITICLPSLTQSLQIHNPWKWRQHIPPNRREKLPLRYNIVSQKIMTCNKTVFNIPQLASHKQAICSGLQRSKNGVIFRRFVLGYGALCLLCLGRRLSIRAPGSSTSLPYRSPYPQSSVFRTITL